MTFQPPATSKALAPVEGAAVVAGRNGTTLRQQAVAAMAANRTFIAAVKPSTAAAQASAAYDQAVRNTRFLNGLGRLMLDLLDGTD